MSTALLRGGGLLLRKGMIRWTLRALATSSCDSGDSQILRSPPLASVDLPDVWTSNSDHDETSTSISNLIEDKEYKGEGRELNSRFFEKRALNIDSANPQTAVVIDGKAIAAEIISRIASEGSRMKKSIGQVPGLAVILVNQRRECQIYARNKIKACEEAGFWSKITELPEHCSEKEVIKALSTFNENPSVHGVIVQLPLPQHLDEGKILSTVCVEKDVDGLHPLNIGNLAMRGREPLFISCTPKGCIELLLRSGVEIRGKKAVVIGRSNIVGLPTYLLLQRHHATVSVLHAFTENPEKITSEADIVISAAGVPNLVRGSWLKSGSIVIDVGTCPIEDPDSEHGYRLMGDVCYDEAVRVVSAITPVPGGVGPMTVAMLLLNTLESAKRAYEFF